jgi:hypothetical protein
MEPCVQARGTQRPATAQAPPSAHNPPPTPLQAVLLAIYGAVLVTQGFVNIVASRGLDTLYTFSV